MQQREPCFFVLPRFLSNERNGITLRDVTHSFLATATANTSVERAFPVLVAFATTLVVLVTSSAETGFTQRIGVLTADCWHFNKHPWS